MTCQSTDLIASIIDEIALEGLDGITLQALWLRLAARFNDPLPLPKGFMDQVWLICKKVKHFSFYELETPREPLVLFNRYDHVHPDFGIIYEPPDIPPDIYPHCPIQDRKTGDRGSCSTYYTRKNIRDEINNLNLDEAIEKYGMKLVIVASQQVRMRALVGNTVSPTLELTLMHYCFLERVGRSRYHGEVTQGKLSLTALKLDPKKLFYHRKSLLQHKLITKQVHYQKSGTYCGSGSLVHLPRFYVEQKSKLMYLAEKVIEILKSKPNGTAEYEEIKRKLGLEQIMKKLFKTSFFQKIIKSDEFVPYREMYPNAAPNEWQMKNDSSREKMIRVVKMLHQDINVNEIWNREDKDDEENNVYLDVSHHKFNVSYLKQTNDIIEKSEMEGISQGKLGKKMGLTKLQSRSTLRNLMKSNIIATYMHDVGRQRITKYVSQKFEKNSNMSKQYNKEMHKIKDLLTEKAASERENENNLKIDEPLQVKNEIFEKPKDESTNDQASCSNDRVDQIDNATPVVNEDKDKDNDEDTRYNERKITELKSLFNTVNSILHKYRWSKFRSKYKCTSLRFTSRKIQNSKDDRKKDNICSSDASSERTLSNSTSTKPQNSQDDKEKQKAPSADVQKFAEDPKTSLLYNSIKINLTEIAQKPVFVGKGVGKAFSFKEVFESKNNKGKNRHNISARMLRRANMIIEAVKEHQVIDDTMKLLRMIYKEERKEGYHKKIDKKSLIRLLLKLAADNLVKTIKLTLSANGREKNLTFICDPKLDINHTVIKSAIEQAKYKFCVLASHKAKIIEKKMKMLATKSKRGKSIEPKDSKERLQDLSKSAKESKDMLNLKYDPKAGKRYGLSPKCIRLQTMHILLFYLVYDHPGTPKLSQEEQLQILRSSGFQIDDSLAKEFSTIYSTEVNWKMFLPPLPKHNGWPDGWALMCDVLLGIPLSMFVKVHNIAFDIPELYHYLNHPIRKHYLVKNLPMSIRSILLYSRKYIFSIHDTIIRLGYIGLVQFGPQRLKDKDQVVEKYWYDMWTICVNTPLGGRCVMHGKDILLEDITKKTAMIEAVAARNAEEAPERDTGTVPGDRKGAAGIDSAFFAHLKRNWNWSSNYNTSHQTKNVAAQSTMGQRDLHLSKIQAKPIKYDSLKKVTVSPNKPSSNISAHELRKKVFDHFNEFGRRNELLRSCQSGKQKSFVRRMMPRKRSVQPRLKYDEDDYQAMQRMNKLRVDWDSHEDNILLVCKVAMKYLSPNPRKQVIGFIAVRDVLRTFSYNSYNKTSRACQRRILYMMKQPRTANYVALGVEEIKQDRFVNKQYGGVVSKLKDECANSAEFEKQITEVFKELVGYIIKKYYNIAEIKPKKHAAMPKTAQEFNLLFEVVYPAKHHNEDLTKDVRNVNDIYSAVINSIIHSSMCCGKDRRCWSYQLFKVYQHYPETLLRQAMTKIRSDHIVTVKKHHLSSVKKFGNYMPMSSSQYQLSLNYIYKFQTKWPYEVFKEAYDIYAKLLEWYSGLKDVPLHEEEVFAGAEIRTLSGGMTIVLHDLLANNQIDFDMELPDQVIMLDARYQGETYFKVAQKYQDILKRLYRFKYENPDAENVEVSEIETRGTRKDSSNRKRLLGDDNSEETIPPKMPHVVEKCDKRKSTKRCRFSETDTEKTSSNRKIELEESTSKDHSSADEQTKEANCSSRKRHIDIEEDSMDGDEPFAKRIRRNSEECINIDYVDEEMDSCEDLESFGKDLNVKLCEPLESLKVELNEEVNEETASTSSTQLDNAINLTSAPRRVNEIINNVLPEASYFNFYSKLDASDAQKKYTRIAMLRLKKDLNNFTVTDSHHAHEYFVVNTFRMFYKLKTSSLIESNDVERFRNYSIPSQLVPLRIESINNLLTKLNKYAIFPRNGISYKNCKEQMRTREEMSEIELKYIDAVHDFVQEKKEMGVSSHELLDKFFDEQGEDLYKVVSLLIENRVFLRSGVTNSRYIHYQYVDPWLTHSYKINRHEQESLVSFKDSIYATMYHKKTTIETERNKENSENHVAEINIETKQNGEENGENHLVEMDIETKQNGENSENHVLEMDTEAKRSHNVNNVNHIIEADIETKRNEEKCKIHDEEMDNGFNVLNNREEDKKESETGKEKVTRTSRRIYKYRACLSPEEDLYKPTQQLDFTRYEDITVVTKPWIRIDGLLNRKVLDRMLGAVLSYCLLHPGLLMTKVQTRFSPALQPFHTRELVEILIKLGCLESKHLKKTRVTLFSPPAEVKISNLTADTVAWSSDDEVMLEPTTTAILRFSTFLSTRTYSTDFIP
ncbi:general transcription factor 3C polypeptide 1 isoform X2 [Pseudomyrmex gracilis]|uniref:general transcription factor 3C polypeptide 1 isoform X2 n=1 Tax=Pseudomyrmex gracilis TaxID=219809 RepID=UPI0009957B2D|nr:general transcription factor 3C polypeptide 1 isoform X2 [Pseudomyrmex gracilis]